MKRILSIAILLAAMPVFALAQGKKMENSRSRSSAVRPTVAEAEKFVAEAERKLQGLNLKVQRASWVQSNFITYDTENIAADASNEYTGAVTELARQARQFDGLKLPYDTARKLMLLKLALTLPAPSNAAEREEMTKITVSMESDYGKGKYCPEGENGKCLSLNDMERIMAESRDPEELKKIWLGWHKVSPPYRARYTRFVELANKGAREMGYKDVGAMWRAKYDMPPDAFAAEMERLWQQVKPLYDSLYTYTRARLAQKYGTNVVQPNALIPAHLLGNMWSQDWSNIYPLLKPENNDPGYDLTQILKARHTDARAMVRYGETFFKSLGFASLPETFWERSLLTKPQDRDVVCHASAWDLDNQKDVRLKMCIEINAEDFATVHHELGHN